MKILVTGSNGLLGQKLLSILSKDPAMEILAVSRGTNRSVAKGYDFIQADITDKNLTCEIVQNFMPTVIINTAAMTQVDECELHREDCHRNNVDAVAHLIEACHLTDSFLVQLSTDFIFDGSKGPLSEDESPDPVNYYGVSKLAAEKLVMSSGLSWAIARTILVYGCTPGMSRNNIVLWVKQKLELGESIKVVNDQYRTPTLAEDLAVGCYLIAKKQKQGIYHISGNEMLTPFQMAHKIADYFNLDKSLIEEADANTFSQPAKRPLKTGFIIDKAISELGYRPQTFTEGLAIMAGQLA